MNYQPTFNAEKFLGIFLAGTLILVSSMFVIPPMGFIPVIGWWIITLWVVVNLVLSLFSTIMTIGQVADPNSNLTTGEKVVYTGLSWVPGFNIVVPFFMNS